MQKLHITLINTQRVIGAKGGTEKVFCAMANSLCRAGHIVTAVCCEEKQGLPGFPLDPQVRFINAGYNSVPFLQSKFLRPFFYITFPFSKDNWKRKRALLKFDYYATKIGKSLKNIRTDVFISFQPESTGAINRLNSRSEHPAPIVTMFHSIPTAFPLLRLLPEEFSKNRSVNQVLMAEYEKLLKDFSPKANVVHIPNEVPQFTRTADRSAKKIIMVARIDHIKSQDIVVKAFSFLKTKFPEWSVEFWGETTTDPDYTKTVSSLIKENNLTDQVFLCGTSNNIPDKLAESSIFVYPSRIEGFPLSLTEAMSMGLPSVGWKGCASVNTLIEDGKNGFLCDYTPESLADSLEKLMQDEELRVKFGNYSKAKMKQYSPDSVHNQWMHLLLSLAKGN